MGYTCNIIDKNSCYLFVFIICKGNFIRMRSQVFPKYKGPYICLSGGQNVSFLEIFAYIQNELSFAASRTSYRLHSGPAFVDFHISTFSLTDVLKES